MRKLSHFVAFLLILFLCLPVSAQNTSFDAGEVLYHQDFSAVTDISASGVTMGTSTSPQTMISVAGDSLDLITKGGGRVYALLPPFVKGDTYTAEFSFSFSEIGAENGYLAEYNINCDEETTEDGETVSGKASYSITFNNPGTESTVSLPADADKYQSSADM